MQTRRAPVSAKAAAAPRRASIFRNGVNQAVRLPQEFRFPEGVRDVQIRKQGDSLVITPARRSWASFFASKVAVPDDFLAARNDLPPQRREPL